MENGLKMDYSVVICSFNKLASLKLVAQKVKSLRPESEIILSDDFSTDGTIEWAKSSNLFSNIRVQEIAGNYRLNTIRNAGIELTTNDYVVILDADCLPEDSYFSGHDIVFKECQKSVSIGMTRNFSSDGCQLKNEDFRNKKNGAIFQVGWEYCYGGNVAFPKSFWNENKFDEDFNGCWGFEDLDFSIRLSKKGVVFYFCPIAATRHLEHPINNSLRNKRNVDLFEKKHGIKMV